MNEFRFKIASTTNEIEEAVKMRRVVFVDEQGIPEEKDDDGYDQQSTHLLIYSEDGTSAIASGRLTILHNEGLLSRIAVIPLKRGLGIGKMIVSELERIAGTNGVKMVSLSPHAYLEKFYTRLGYQKGEGVKTVGKYKLIHMTKVLGNHSA